MPFNSQPAAPQSHWLRGFIRWTGIGPIKSVILARAQVAVVVTDLRAVEEGDALKIKSEGALLIETHTSERRIRATFEETIKTLAEKTYGHPTSRRVSVDGVEYQRMDCSRRLSADCRRSCWESGGYWHQ